MKKIEDALKKMYYLKTLSHMLQKGRQIELYRTWKSLSCSRLYYALC